MAAAVKGLEGDDHQVVPVAILGHKADVCLLALGPDLWRLRRFQTAVAAAGLDVVDSYVSLTEVSEYAQACRRRARRPGCTPSSPRRARRRSASTRCRSGGATSKLVRAPYEEREGLMHGHGGTGPEVRGPGAAARDRVDRSR